MPWRAWPGPRGDAAPIVRAGPYRFVRHPNYSVTIVETFLLPAVFGAYALAVIMGSLWLSVISYKIALEDAALAARRAKARLGPEGQGLDRPAVCRAAARQCATGSGNPTFDVPLPPKAPAP